MGRRTIVLSGRKDLLPKGTNVLHLVKNYALLDGFGRTTVLSGRKDLLAAQNIRIKSAAVRNCVLLRPSLNGRPVWFERP